MPRKVDPSDRFGGPPVQPYVKRGVVWKGPSTKEWLGRINDGAWRAYRIEDPEGAGEQWTVPWIKPSKRKRRAA